MPVNAVRTAAQERLWKKAKACAAAQGHALDYAYVMGIYQRMLGEPVEKAMLGAPQFAGWQIPGQIPRGLRDEQVELAHQQAQDALRLATTPPTQAAAARASSRPVLTPQAVVKDLGLDLAVSQRLARLVDGLTAGPGDELKFRQAWMACLVDGEAGLDPVVRQQLGERGLALWRSRAEQRETPMAGELRITVPRERKLEKAMLFIGPRGGRWADAAHTIPWDDKVHGKPKVTITDKTEDEPVAVPPAPAGLTGQEIKAAPEGARINVSGKDGLKATLVKRGDSWHYETAAGPVGDYGTQAVLDILQGIREDGGESEPGWERMPEGEDKPTQPALIVPAGAAKAGPGKLFIAQGARDRAQMGLFSSATTAKVQEVRERAQQVAKQSAEAGALKKALEQLDGMRVGPGLFVPAGELRKGGGPFIGPRGGKWADAQHTVPWKEPEAKLEVPVAQPESTAKPVDSSFYGVRRKFGVAGGPDEHYLTDAGLEVTAKVGGGVTRAAEEALRALPQDGQPILVEEEFVGERRGRTAPMLRRTPWGEAHGELGAALSAKGLIELSPIPERREKAYRITEKGKQTLQAIEAERARLMVRIAQAHPLEPQFAPTVPATPEAAPSTVETPEDRAARERRAEEALEKPMGPGERTKAFRGQAEHALQTEILPIVNQLRVREGKPALTELTAKNVQGTPMKFPSKFGREEARRAETRAALRRLLSAELYHEEDPEYQERVLRGDREKVISGAQWGSLYREVRSTLRMLLLPEEEVYRLARKSLALLVPLVPLDRLEKGAPRGGKYVKRAPRPGGQGYRYYYSEKGYERATGHVDGQRAADQHLGKRVATLLNKAGPAGLHPRRLAELVRQHGRQRVAGVLKATGCRFDKGRFYPKTRGGRC